MSFQSRHCRGVMLPSKACTTTRNIITVCILILNPNVHYIWGHFRCVMLPSKACTTLTRNISTVCTLILDTKIHYISGYFRCVMLPSRTCTPSDPQYNDRLYINN